MKNKDVTYSPARIWLLASRPKTLPAAAAPVVIGVVLAIEAGVFALWPALAALFGALAIQVGTNFANDYYDFKSGADEGERLGPMRLTQARLVTPRAMLTATVITFALATAAGVYLVYVAGWPIVIIGLLSILFGVMYTGGPYPLGYHGLADIFVLIFFGPVAVGGTFFVQALTINPNVIIAGLAPGLFSIAILTVNNLRDLDNDRAAGKRTLAVRFGRTFARSEYLLCLVIGSLMPVWLWLRTGEHIWAILTALVPLIGVGAIKAVYSKQGRVLNEVLATTGKLLLLYAVLFSVGWLV
ncbi:MAG TPA: 1,4-dihydroxy-2-naphthoate polyprenyltransferase [candidate division Zixibacteria bacterium]|nr:1,4-dihydroxy-2-naphthoate polyprenyltransferase [candidate division Zixibacteria bacterium]